MIARAKARVAAAGAVLLALLAVPAPLLSLTLRQCAQHSTTNHQPPTTKMTMERMDTT
jgi:hypothetical protein